MGLVEYVVNIFRALSWGVTLGIVVLCIGVYCAVVGKGFIEFIYEDN